MSNGTVRVTVDTAPVAQVIERLNDTFVGVGNALHADLRELNAETRAQLIILAERLTAVEDAVNKVTESAAQSEMISAISEFVGQDISIRRNAIYGKVIHANSIDEINIE